MLYLRFKTKGFLGVFYITDILFCVWSNNFYKLIPSLIWFHVCNKEKVVDAILNNCIPLKLFVPQISSFPNISFEWILKSVIRNFRNYSEVSYRGNTNLLLVYSFKEEFLRNTCNWSFQHDSQSRWFFRDILHWSQVKVSFAFWKMQPKRIMRMKNSEYIGE